MSRVVLVVLGVAVGAVATTLGREQLEPALPPNGRPDDRRHDVRGSGGPP